MRVLTVIIILFALTGCANHTYHYYEFETNRISTSHGEIVADLRAQFTKVSNEPQITDYGSPYRLAIFFSSNHHNYSPYFVKKISVKSESGHVLHFFDGGEMKTSWSEYGQDWISSWWCKCKLVIDHQPLIVEFEFIYNLDGVIARELVVQRFKPKYWERRGNDFIDGLMSV